MYLTKIRAAECNPTRDEYPDAFLSGGFEGEPVA